MKFILSSVDISLLEIKSLAGARELQEGETDFEFKVFDPKMTGEITVRLTNLPEVMRRGWQTFKQDIETYLKEELYRTYDEKRKF